MQFLTDARLFLEDFAPALLAVVALLAGWFDCYDKERGKLTRVGLVIVLATIGLTAIGAYGVTREKQELHKGLDNMTALLVRVNRATGTLEKRQMEFQEQVDASAKKQIDNLVSFREESLARMSELARRSELSVKLIELEGARQSSLLRLEREEQRMLWELENLDAGIGQVRRRSELARDMIKSSLVTAQAGSKGVLHELVKYYSEFFSDLWPQQKIFVDRWFRESGLASYNPEFFERAVFGLGESGGKPFKSYSDVCQLMNEVSERVQSGVDPGHDANDLHSIIRKLDNAWEAYSSSVCSTATQEIMARFDGRRAEVENSHQLAKEQLME